ncbi:cold-shock protein [Streptomyces violascens]|uniref:Cold-shock protein n=1 Tax=Streptomyces violascens TaxID=67381 RepID=A0ABQ3QTY0_9ACTN|nr:cold shock domain-containing protein [Streptomyces violascens]GHI40669.1 cold-shock protein [Streptomyces violascens]
MAAGTVTWFNAEEGFGCVGQGQGGPDVFVHCSAASSAGSRSLEEGQQVPFDVTQDPQSAVCTADVMSAFWASVPPG